MEIVIGINDDKKKTKKLNSVAIHDFFRIQYLYICSFYLPAIRATAIEIKYCKTLVFEYTKN